MHRRNITIRFLIFLYVASACVYIFKIGGIYNEFLRNIIYLSFPLIAAIAGICVVKIYGIKNNHGKSFLFMTFGLLLWLMGEGTWVIIEYWLKTEIYPSVGDVFFLLGYVMIFVAFLREIKISKISLKPLKSIVFIICSLIIASLVFYFEIFLVYNQNVAFWENFFNLFYGVGDLLLILSVLFILLQTFEFWKGNLFWPWLSIFLGFAFYLLADIIYSIYLKQYISIIWIYRQIDLLWMAGYLLISCGLFDIEQSIKDIRKSIQIKSQYYGRKKSINR